MKSQPMLAAGMGQLPPADGSLHFQVDGTGNGIKGLVGHEWHGGGHWDDWNVDNKQTILFTLCDFGGVKQLTLCHWQMAAEAKHGLLPATRKSFGLSGAEKDRQRHTRKASTDAERAGEGLSGNESHLEPRKMRREESRREPSSCWAKTI